MNIDIKRCGMVVDNFDFWALVKYQLNHILFNFFYVIGFTSFRWSLHFNSSAVE